MSHTIGQIKEDNQQSTSSSSIASQELSTDVDKTPESASFLSDADYEFLFNQLLEGIAHGWHDRRIDKFFKQLGDRGKPEDWVAWLERLRVKLVTLPVQSKQQLGTIMIRLGELTQSTPEIKKIGFASNRIGRELLFGNRGDIIWEYVGADIVVDASSSAVEEDISDRLPTDFKELGTGAVPEPQPINSVTEEIASNESSTELPDNNLEAQIDEKNAIDDFSLEKSVDLEADKNVDSTSTIEREEVANEDPTSDPSIEHTSLQDPLSSLDESTAASSNDAVAELETLEDSELKDLSTSSQEFEFELDSSATSPKVNLASNNFEELLNQVEIEKTPPESLVPRLPQSESDPVAIDMERVMNLIQEDPALAQEISQKLNISPPLSTSNNVTANHLDPERETQITTEADKHSFELIEGWFNLGLKQVSGGKFDKAIASWEKALKINPNLSEAWHNRGSALGRLGEYQQAVDSFEKALVIDPKNHQAWNDRAHALYQMQEWSQAADSWSNAVKLAPGNHLFWYNRGCALEQIENWAEAIASYEKCLEIKPDFEPARSRYTNLIADSSHAN